MWLHVNKRVLSARHLKMTSVNGASLSSLTGTLEQNNAIVNVIGNTCAFIPTMSKHLL